MRYLHERRAALGGTCRRGAAMPRALPVPPLDGVRRLRAAGRGQGDEHDDGLRAPARRPAEGPGARARAWCRSSPTRRAPSAWPTCSSRSASTRRVGQRYEPEDIGSMLSYREARTGRFSRKASARPARSSSWVAAATSRTRARHADAAVLHLLLDVRLPARRRPDLGRRRPALARLPARRHGRAAPRSAAKACSTRTAAAC